MVCSAVESVSGLPMRVVLIEGSMKMEQPFLLLETGNDKYDFHLYYHLQESISLT